MSREGNKAIIRRLFDEVFNQGNVEVIDEIVADNVVGHDATSREPKRGLASLKQVTILFCTAFPDGQYLLSDLIAEEERVVARWGLQGTHRSEFMEIPATGKQVSITGIVIYRLANNKIVEYWGNFDTFGLMQQLGVIPSRS